jgi:hypothetical protein
VRQGRGAQRVEVVGELTVVALDIRGAGTAVAGFPVVVADVHRFREVIDRDPEIVPVEVVLFHDESQIVLIDAVVRLAAFRLAEDESAPGFPESSFLESGHLGLCLLTAICSNSQGGTWPIGPSSRRLLNQSTHTSVASSTGSWVRHGPSCQMTSAL